MLRLISIFTEVIKIITLGLLRVKKARQVSTSKSDIIEIAVKVAWSIKNVLIVGIGSGS